MTDRLYYPKGILCFLLMFFALSYLPLANPGKNKKAKVTYKEHVNTAKKAGVPLLKTNAQLKKLVKQKKLTSVKDGKGFVVGKLTHSKPYLTPEANKILSNVGKQFYSKSKKNTFSVTSITRTMQDQDRLRKVNPNATKNISSHNYGCSFDISYVRFNKKKAPNPKLEKMLNKTLDQYQEDGKLYFIKEKREMCYHITIRNKNQ